MKNLSSAEIRQMFLDFFSNQRDIRLNLVLL